MGIQNTYSSTSPKDLLLKSIPEKDFDKFLNRFMSKPVDEITADLALKLIFHSPNVEENYKKGMSKKKYPFTYVVLNSSTK